MQRIARWHAKRRTMALAVALCALVAGCGDTAETDAARIERDILASPGQQEMWLTIKEEYPQDFDALVAQMQAIEPRERGDEGRVNAVASRWLIAFLDRIGQSAVEAPAAELIEWSAAEGKLFAVLQRDAVTDCAAMTMGQAITIDLSKPAATDAITQRNLAFVRAAAAGRRDPQTYAQPGEVDWQRLDEAIAATGIAPALQATLGSPEAMQALSPAEQCEVGTALYTGLSDLPNRFEPVMAAYLLAPG